MNTRPAPGASPAIESLLAAEREIVSERPEMKKRVLERARAAMETHALASTSVFLSRQTPRLRVGMLAAAAITLTGLCALAFFAGYAVKGRSTAAVPSVSSFPTTVIVLPSVVSEAIPMESAIPEPPPSPPPQPTVAPRAASEIKAYTLELAVLQPAQQAVGRGDFGSALRAIAEHQRRFPSGRLAEEREALRIKALVGLGQMGEAERAGGAFRKRFPRSAMLPRIDAMLGKGK